MRLQLDKTIFIDYEKYKKNKYIIHMNRNTFLSNLSLIFSYGARDGENNEGLLHLAEHYINSSLQKKKYFLKVFQFLPKQERKKSLFIYLLMLKLWI